jgi:hypothetical protein
MNETLDVHFREKHNRYTTPRTREVHVEAIPRTPDKATTYALKGLKLPDFTGDHLLILPRSTAELDSL